MCGRLKLEKIAGKIGMISPVESLRGEVFQGTWNNHARVETLEKFTSNGWKEGSLPSVTSYTEGHEDKEKEFPVPAGKAIKVVYQPNILTSQGTNPFNIVTREASTEEEKAIHNRWPVLIDKK